MRLAFVTMETTQHTDTEGARRFERIARLLAEKGHDVQLFCGQWWDDYTETFEKDGLTYRGVSLGTPVFSYCARLPGVLAAYNPDLIHARPVPAEQVLAAGTASTLTRAPLVVEWYGDEQLSETDRRTRWAASNPDEIITPSEYVRTTVRELGATETQTSVIPESIDYDQIETVEPAEEVDVVYAHSLDESANIQDFLLGLAELRERDWSATVIGDGPKREEYEQEAADLRIGDRVEFVGECSRERRIAIYRGAHAFVQTAYREYFAAELLWALACGCVGIVEYQADSSAHELIENYERSYRVTNPQQLADAIVDAGEFDHQTLAEHWGDYDHSAVIRSYLREYRQLTGEEPASQASRRL